MQQTSNQLLDQLDYFKIPGPGTYGPLRLKGSTPSYKFGREQKFKVLKKDFNTSPGGLGNTDSSLLQHNIAISFSKNTKEINTFTYNPGPGTHNFKSGFGNSKGYSFGRKLDKQINQSSKVDKLYVKE